jgi:hypothetical protein
MTMDGEALCQMERHLCLAQGEEDFREFHAPDKNLVLWRRSADSTVSSLLDDIDLSSDFSLRRELSLSGFVEVSARLRQDHRFSGVTSEIRPSKRLRAITTACRLSKRLVGGGGSSLS